MTVTDAIRRLRLEDIGPSTTTGLGWVAGGLGRTKSGSGILRQRLGVPYHLTFLARALVAEGTDAVEEALSSIPFYSLCRGLLMPLAGMTPEKAAHLFGLAIAPPPAAAEREAYFQRFLDGDFGLSVEQRLSCLVGDPFAGGPSRFRRESLLRLLRLERLVTRRDLLDRLSIVGDVAVLFAESRPAGQGDPSLTAAEVLAVLARMPAERRNVQFALLQSLLQRCGKVEAYFLAKWILRSVGLRYESEMLGRMVAAHYGLEAEAVSHALALSDVFEVVRLLEAEGPDGLKQIQLQPLVPIRPALAGGTLDTLKRYPAWVERKYDGIRLMLHKASDRFGAVLCGAYSRNRRDYLELLPGLDGTIKMLPAHAAIVDGELHGTVMTVDGVRPATVYEVFGRLQGDAAVPVQLRYAAFDLIYLDGVDLTGQPLAERRARLQALVGGLVGAPLPLPLSLAEGQSASHANDVKRLYQHFRAQGYEGVIAKEPAGPYRLASRDPGWRKRKPEVTLDLVLLGAVLAVTRKEKAGMFGSYVLGARNPDGGFDDVGDVAGVDRVRDAEIQQAIMREGLLSGHRIERKTVSGGQAGFELVPFIVVTVRMSGLVRDPASGQLSLRDPKLVAIRSDKAASEAESIKDIDAMYLRQQMG